jgi:hypothetical protein
VNSIQVVIFSSTQALYGVMSGQVAGLYRDSGEPSADTIVDLVQFVEEAFVVREPTDVGGVTVVRDPADVVGAIVARDPADVAGVTAAAARDPADDDSAVVTKNQTEKEFVVRSHRGFRYRIPGPVELTELRLDDFRPIPALVSKFTENGAIRAAFAYGDLIGLLVDLDMVTMLP